MTTSIIKTLLSTTLLLSIGLIGCEEPNPIAIVETPSQSDILDNSLSAVVTVKVNETDRGKSAFGFSQTEGNIANKAYRWFEE